MRWITAVWNTLDQSVFSNCWRHTGLLNISINTLDLAIDSTLEGSMDAEFSAEFNRFIQSARIQSAMTLDDFLNPPTEDSFAHLQLTDDDILEVVQHIDESEEQEDEINVPTPRLNIPKRERILALAQVIAFIEDAPNSWKPERQETVRFLRRMQRDFRREIAEEEQQKLKQRSISDCFRERN